MSNKKIIYGERSVDDVLSNNLANTIDMRNDVMDVQSWSEWRFVTLHTDGGNEPTSTTYWHAIKLKFPTKFHTLVV